MQDEAISCLKQISASINKDHVSKMQSERDEVLSRYQPIFCREALSSLSALDFQSFLLAKNNRHWSGLHRQGPRICQNMGGLRAALLNLHEASQPIDARFDFALQNVNHLGKGILSAVLYVMYPDDFGVWNRTSEGGLKLLGIWPKFDHGLSPGKRYSKINNILRQLKDEVGVDLWILDWLLWVALTQTVNTDDSAGSIADALAIVEESGELQKFGLEKYLHEFLRDNWSNTELGKYWNIFGEDGDEDAGYKYPCGSVGQIDILARHKNNHDWLVIELKREQAGDATIGQLLRYMGFIKYNLAKEDDKVFGLIIAYTLDEKLQYAVSTLPNVALHTYTVDFKLGSPVKVTHNLPFKLPGLEDLSTRG